MNAALVLLEIQNDYFPNGRIPLEKSVEAGAKAEQLLRVFREKKLPIIHVQHISTNPNASYMLPCTRGAEFHTSVQPTKGETIIKKHSANSFKDSQLLNHLIKNKINQLVICGMMTHTTIDATTRAAQDLGFHCTIIHDACAAKQLEFNFTTIPAQNVHHAFLAALQLNDVVVATTEDYLHKLGAHTSEDAVA